jgi:hypothetical protein
VDTQWPKDFLPEIERRGASARGAGRFAPETGLRRSETEAFIAAVFARAHRARIRKFMPLLLGLRDRGGRLTAACGLRAAGGGPVFLEHYLAGPVERAVAAAAGVPIARARVVEVGNLAVAPPGSARELIAALTEYLVPTPFQWVVFTGGPALRNAFLRLGVPLSHLAHARIEALPEDGRAHWGTYYDNGPTVCAVEVEAARAALARRAQHASASVSA